jgi:fructose-1,6-bisphosphatase/inositol monophosphatase family enzyme
MARRVAAKAKTTPKKRVTKTKAKRAATKKAPIRAPGSPPQQGDAAAETVIVDVIEEPVPGVTLVTEFEATRVVQGSED